MNDKQPETNEVAPRSPVGVLADLRLVATRQQFDDAWKRIYVEFGGSPDETVEVPARLEGTCAVVELLNRRLFGPRKE